MKWALAMILTLTALILTLGSLWAMPTLLSPAETAGSAGTWSVLIALLALVGVRWRIAFGAPITLHDDWL